MKKIKMSFGVWMGICAVLCFTFLLFAYLLEYYHHLKPCALCVLQRVVLWILGIGFIIAWMHSGPRWLRYMYSIFLLIFSVVGIGLASRQIWIHHLPMDQAPSCIASMERLLAVHPVFEVLTLIVTGSGDCAKESFLLLGLSLAAWSLLAFVILGICAVVGILKVRTGPK